MDTKNVIQFILVVTLPMLIGFLIKYVKESKEVEKQETVKRMITTKSRWYTAVEFLNLPTLSSSIDTSGCYVITIFNSRQTGEYDSNYDNVYVGQSEKVFKRVRNHLTGKGNGDVYADYREGKYIYVLICRCRRYEMNEVERELINVYKATKSYNRTSGGGRRRDKIKRQISNKVIKNGRVILDETHDE